MSYLKETRLVAAVAVACSGILLAQTNTATPKVGSGLTHPRAVADYGNLSIGFEANCGQAESGVDALAHGPGYTMLLRQGEAELTLTGGVHSAAASTAQIRMGLLGGNRHAQFSQENRLEAKSNYFFGKEPAHWQTDVPNYARVRYTGIYPGIDVVYYGNGRELEHDFVVAPGADPGQIRVALSGAKTVRLDKRTGDLVLKTDAGDLRLLKPATYQTVNGKRVDVPSEYKIEADGAAGFRLGNYDRAVPLTIDPVLSYSTIITNASEAIAVDGGGNVYIPGTGSGGGTGGHQPLSSASLYKVSPGGSALIYATFFGGSLNNSAAAVVVDAEGEAYLTGSTNSPDFPVTGGFQSSLKATGSASNAFIAKLSFFGNKILYASYLGGSGGESGTGIALDGAGQTYLTGNTQSTDFPTYLPLQATLHGTSDAYVAAVSADGTSLRYATYLGGSGTEGASGIAIDANGEVIVAGNTTSSDFPLKDAIQGTLKGSQNVFVSKVNASGTALLYSTYLGGSLYDQADALAGDPGGDAFIVGTTQSTDFPLANAYQTSGPGGTGFGTDFFPNDAVVFVTKINPSGSALVYSTYMGDVLQPSWEWMYFPGWYNLNEAFGVAADSSGNAFVTGYTFSANFPVTSDAYQNVNNGLNPDCGSNAFVSEFGPAGGLVYSTYLGGYSGGHDGSGISICDAQGSTAAYGIALDRFEDIYISGIAGWPHGFPITAGAYSGQTSNGNSFLTKFSTAPLTATTTTLTSSANPQGAGQKVTFTAQVTTGSATPVTTGEVIFTVDGVAQTPVLLYSSGTATFPISTLTEGNHTIKAAYSGRIDTNASSAQLTEAILTTQVPTISPVGGTYRSAQTVRISDPATTAAIYYTTNGTTPTTASTLYTEPIAVATSETVKAIAQIPGRADSTVATAAYVIVRTTTTPAFSVPAGTYPAAKTVTITDSTPGAVIYYTLNGTTPTVSSAVYSAPIVVSKSETIKIMALKTGYNDSAVATATYVIETPSVTPAFSVPGGTYTTAKTVAITDGTPGAVIHYTINGTTPTPSSTVYSTPIAVSKSETVEAIAVRTASLNSAVATAVYVIETPATTPAFSVRGGTYAGAQTVTITDATSGAVIHYTLDGSTPTASSPVYGAPIVVSKSETVNAIAVKAGYLNSAVASAKYVIQ